MKHKNFKCKFNPAQAMSEHDVYGMQYPMSYGININHSDMTRAIPEKKQEDYDPKFIEWFVNFHAGLFRIKDWDRFPEWMMPLLKKRTEEIHEGLHFIH